ncbi:MAG: hypothetical protein LRZ99_07365 [Desulfotomaculum sp.]|nr:hypothetical protein [Desulfotomaculum sp.]
MLPTIMLTVNASGAATAAKSGQVVVIVDVIDMSTTCEAALDAGVLAVYGAAPDQTSCPVTTNPQQVGLLAGLQAIDAGTDVVLVAEPRVASEAERMKNISKVMLGLEQAGAKTGVILPNLGAETAKMADLKGCILVAVTSTGGVAYDAALTAGAPAVLTATVARTIKKKGFEPAKAGVARALAVAKRLKTGITVVAASANSLEDILAAEYLVKEMIRQSY